MTKKEKCEWRNWCYFCSRRVREFVFLSLWACMVWAVDTYIVRPFPMNGLPKYMLFTFEGLFDISTILELILLLYWPYKAHTSRWLNKRQTPDADR